MNSDKNESDWKTAYTAKTIKTTQEPSKQKSKHNSQRNKVENEWKGKGREKTTTQHQKGSGGNPSSQAGQEAKGNTSATNKPKGEARSSMEQITRRQTR